jgi:hypothetical protein
MANVTSPPSAAPPCLAAGVRAEVRQHALAEVARELTDELAELCLRHGRGVDPPAGPRAECQLDAAPRAGAHVLHADPLPRMERPERRGDVVGRADLMARDGHDDIAPGGEALGLEARRLSVAAVQARALSRSAVDDLLDPGALGRPE